MVPWPATTPPARTIVSPGAISPMNAPVSRNADTPTTAYVHAPSASAMSSITFFGSGSADRTPLAYTASATVIATPSALRSRLSLRQRQMTNPATSTAATAAMTSRADMESEGTSAQLGQERAVNRGCRVLGSASVVEEPEARGPRAAYGGAERAGRPEPVEPCGQIRAQRQGRVLEVVLEPRNQFGGWPRGERAQRLGVKAVPAAAKPVELRVDGGGREAGRVRDQHGRQWREREWLDSLPDALHDGVAWVELTGHIRAEVGGEAEELLPAERRAGELVCHPQGRRGVRTPAAQPGRHRDALVDPQLERGQVSSSARAEVSERAGGQVVAGHARALDEV